ncbi:hypothetical protein WUBG_05182, partial [Wuchereria bancrofti]
DVATKKLSLIKLRNCKQWWKGHQWLEHKKFEWPHCEFNYSSNDEFVEAIVTKVTEVPQNRYNLLMNVALAIG